jgi:sugar/nucleoside kinase (ribokinase family)
MIVVVGSVVARERVEGWVPAGVTARVALAAAGQGHRVELVSRMGDDATGDAVLLALSAAGVGHVASLRDAAHATTVLPDADEPVDPDEDVGPTAGSAGAPPGGLDAADVGLALRYLPEIGVVVLVHPAGPEVLAEAVAGAAYASAPLIVLVEPGAEPDPLPATALVLEVEPDAETIADAVGRYAAALDAGQDPSAAFRATVGSLAEPGERP